MDKVKVYLLLTILSLLPILFLACGLVSTPTLTPTTEEPEESVIVTAPAETQPEEPVASSTSADTQVEELVLSTTLKRNCQLDQSSFRNFDDAGPKIGEKAVNFTLKDISGNEFRLSRLLAEKPVMMVFGSFT